MAYQVDFHISSPFIAVGIPQHILTTRLENPAAAQHALPVSSLHIRSDFSIGIIPLPISFVIMIKSGFSRRIVLVSAAPSLVHEELEIPNRPAGEYLFQGTLRTVNYIRGFNVEFFYCKFRFSGVRSACDQCHNTS